MEDRDTWVVNTLLFVSRATLLISCAACSSLAANAVGDLETWVVIFRLGSRGRWGGSMLSSRNWCTRWSRSVQRIDLLDEISIILLRFLLQLRRLVGGGMSACRAGRNLHKLIKGQNSRLAALPSFMQQISIQNMVWCFLIKLTFLPLVENRRTGVVLALLIRVRKLLSTTLMDTLLGHVASSFRFVLHRLELKIFKV